MPVKEEEWRGHWIGHSSAHALFCGSAAAEEEDAAGSSAEIQSKTQ
tara:strand:- start:293 stop:430 length:138 start_codon:yes stop_codon:yes gene_type:complete